MIDNSSTKNENSLPDRIGQILEHFQLSQNSLAKTLGIRQSNVHFWLKGGRMPQSTAMAFQVVLGIRWQWLLNGEGKMLLEKIERFPEEMQQLIDIWSRMTESDRLRVLGYAEGVLAEKSNGKK